MKRFIILILLGFLIVSCRTVSPLPKDTPLPSITPIPTDTPKPLVNCPEEEVINYLDNIDLLLEKWDDTKLRAESTSRISLSPEIGELQDIKRDTRRVDKPDCAIYLNDVIIIAMERDIDAFISFLSQDSDSVVSIKLEAAEEVWEIANEEFEKFKESPFEAYQSSVSATELDNSLDELDEFNRPENWIDEEIPDTNLLISIPRDWSVVENETLSVNTPDKTFKIIIASLEDSMLLDFDSDSGRLFALQTLLETTDFDYYLEKNADIEIHSKNKAYVIEFSFRANSGDDIKDRVWAFVITPEEKEVLVSAETTRAQFAQIEMITYRTILGSIR